MKFRKKLLLIPLISLCILMSCDDALGGLGLYEYTFFNNTPFDLEITDTNGGAFEQFTISPNATHVVWVKSRDFLFSIEGGGYYDRVYYSLESQKITLEYEPEPTKLYILRAVASPTNSESVTLRNNSGAPVNLLGWTLGDHNDPDAYELPDLTVSHLHFVTFIHPFLPFEIDDYDEVLSLTSPLGIRTSVWVDTE